MKFCFLFIFILFSYADTTLDMVKKRGYVKCGVNPGLAAFSQLDENGVFNGFDIDYCKVIAAAVFGDVSKVEYKPLSTKIRFNALISKDIDVLIRNTTWTMTRDVSLGLAFNHITFYDGQGFMVPKKLKINEIHELNGASICVVQGTTTEINLSDYFSFNQIKFSPVYFESFDQAIVAYQKGRCDAFTSDFSGLIAARLSLPNGNDQMILSERISKEPLAPVVRVGDEQWFKIVNWSIFSTIAAEEMGVTSSNIDSLKDSKDPKIQRILNVKQASDFGLSDKFAYWIIKNVGNYKEIYDRNIGETSKFKVARGLNALWRDGGLQYSPPFR